MRARWASAVREGPSPSSPHGARWRLSTGRWAGMARPGSVGAVLRALLRAGSGRIEACACARVGGESMCSRESAHTYFMHSGGGQRWVVRVFARVGHFYRFTSLVLEGRQLYPFHRFRFSGRSHTFTAMWCCAQRSFSHPISLRLRGSALASGHPSTAPCAPPHASPPCAHTISGTLLHSSSPHRDAGPPLTLDVCARPPPFVEPRPPTWRASYRMTRLLHCQSSARPGACE